MAKGKMKNKEQQTSEKHRKEKGPGESFKSTSGIWQDERFQHLVSDPRFKSLPKHQRKVKIDKRFQGMFTNEKFKVKYTVDKYGRRVNKSNAEDLKKYYELNSSAEESEDEQDDQKIKEKEKDLISYSSEEEEKEEREKEEKAIIQDSDSNENDYLIGDGEEVAESVRDRLVDPDIDYARGEGRLITDSSSDEETSEDEDPEMYIDHVWGELANDAETTDESTKRLAVCNMDWDRVRAVDLMVLFSSFLPPGGSVISVKIYLSEFGKERLREEELHGPPELVGLAKEDFKKIDCVSRHKEQASFEDSASENELVQEQDSDAGEGDDYHMEKLRQYQLNRLRYYYAVVEFDSVETADKIYQECDSLEYESSATKLDLRFIPDDTSFDQDEPTDVCTELPDANTYQPRQFTTTALQQAKVDLTWDETAVDRKELGDKLSSGKLEGISDKDLRKIVAYSSEEEQDDEEGFDRKVEDKIEEENEVEQKLNVSNQERGKRNKSNKKDEVINKYKALLNEINEKEEKDKQKKKYEMEFSWEVEEVKTNPFKDTQKTDLDKNTKENLTPIEKVLLKRAEKNKKRKEERKKKKLQSNGKNSESDLDSLPDDIDMNDPYFAEEFANGDFADPKDKRKEKQKKQKALKMEQEEENEKQTRELELLLDDNNEVEGRQHFSLEKIIKREQETNTKKKRRKQIKKSKNCIDEAQKSIEDNFNLNIDDQRFKAVFTSHEFNIDPTSPHFKKTKAMEQLIYEKLKRRHGDEKVLKNTNAEEESVSKKPKYHIENTLLVKSLKRKIKLKQQDKNL